VPGQKQKYLDKNRNTWTKNRNTRTGIEIFEQKRRHLDKDRSISIEEKYVDRNENKWTKRNILEQNPMPMPRGLA
jgi:hypothetical protein